MRAQTGGGDGSAPATSASGGCGGGGGSDNAPATGTSCRGISDDAGGGGSDEEFDGPATGAACCRDAYRVTAGDTRGRVRADEVVGGDAGTAARAGVTLSSLL